ncbi:hypothetical protein ACF1AU_36660 [Streptomyces rubrogriseus]|uniref:hypothetical protein n=1 Tax=Streptomyces rubrogriseus TaxID=194673 RepID=UPI0036F5423B
MPHYRNMHEGSARVLVVDDEPELAYLLSTALGTAGWQPRIAGDGRRALELARKSADSAR